MEIERKFLVTELPVGLDTAKKKIIEQSYISTSPVIRLRRSNDDYILTCKGKGLMAREEFELFIEKDDYEHLIEKAEGTPIKKTRYLLPYKDYTIEFDVFENLLAGLMVAEVEFTSVDEAQAFVAPAWFGVDVTQDGRYQNSKLTALTSPAEVKALLPGK